MCVLVASQHWPTISQYQTQITWCTKDGNCPGIVRRIKLGWSTYLVGQPVGEFCKNIKKGKI